MTIRAATSSDLPVAFAPWLHEDAWTPSGRCLVAEQSGGITAAGLRIPHALHPSRDFAEFAVDGDAAEGEELLAALVALGEKPIVLRTLPGKPEHSIALAAGGTVLMHCPASAVDICSPEVEQWCSSHRGEVRLAAAFTDEELVGLWAQFYRRSHEYWMPLGDDDTQRESFARLGDAVNRDLTSVAFVDDMPIAATFVFGPASLDTMPVPAVLRDRGDAATALAATMAHALEGLRDAVCSGHQPIRIEFDAHGDDEVFMAVLATLPDVQPSALHPMEIIEVSVSR